MKDNQFRYQWAKPSDVEQIVTLFELCLGADGGAPTVSFWNWKHNQNPGGVSPVILAWDGDKLVGIRAFMCFKLHKNEEIYKAYRPVDTATHPEYQGKGIFRNLTLKLIEDLQQIDEKAFIFNTPNSQSKPGYLKMGWIEWGKPLLQLLPTFSFFGKDFTNDQTRLLNYDFSKTVVERSNMLTVYKGPDYYKWRYQQITLQSYGMKEVKMQRGTYLIIYRKKRMRFINEFRICDVLKDNVSCSKIPIFVLLRLFWSFGLGFISFISINHFCFTIKIRKKAPIVTYRKINDQDPQLLFSEVNWQTGELELF